MATESWTRRNKERCKKIWKDRRLDFSFILVSIRALVCWVSSFDNAFQDFFTAREIILTFKACRWGFVRIWSTNGSVDLPHFRFCPCLLSFYPKDETCPFNLLPVIWVNTQLHHCRLRLFPFTLSPLCVTRMKTAGKWWPREILRVRSARFLAPGFAGTTRSLKPPL